MSVIPVDHTPYLGVVPGTLLPHPHTFHAREADIRRKSGERISQSKDVVYKRCPQAMLRFYETYLK